MVDLMKCGAKLSLIAQRAWCASRQDYPPFQVLAHGVQSQDWLSGLVLLPVRLILGLLPGMVHRCTVPIRLGVPLLPRSYAKCSALSRHALLARVPCAREFAAIMSASRFQIDYTLQPRRKDPSGGWATHAVGLTRCEANPFLAVQRAWCASRQDRSPFQEPALGVLAKIGVPLLPRSFAAWAAVCRHALRACVPSAKGVAAITSASRVRNNQPWSRLRNLQWSGCHAFARSF